MAEGVRRAAVGVALVYAGLLCGVSLLATPAKFLAPSLTLPVAVDVGRATFHVLRAVELLLCPLLCVLCVAARRSVRVLAPMAAVAAVVAAQSLWLLPVLDARVAAIIAGAAPPPSVHHHIYAACEVAKVVLLVLVAAAVAAAAAVKGAKAARATPKAKAS